MSRIFTIIFVLKLTSKSKKRLRNNLRTTWQTKNLKVNSTIWKVAILRCDIASKQATSIQGAIALTRFQRDNFLTSGLYLQFPNPLNNNISNNNNDPGQAQARRRSSNGRLSVPGRPGHRFESQNFVGPTSTSVCFQMFSSLSKVTFR